MDGIFSSDPVSQALFGISLVTRGITLKTLGAAYLGLLATGALTAALFIALRATLVISPNRSSRDYGLYAAVLLVTLLTAMALENELLPYPSRSLPYAALPQLLLLFVIHLLIYYRQETWLVGLGVASMASTIMVVGGLLYLNDFARPVHWATLPMALVLVVFAWWRCISTKAAFLKASSIYLSSKETLDEEQPEQKPWLGLPQWVALVTASLFLALLNEVLGGAALAQIPAVEIVGRSILLLGITLLVSAIPAATYWLARHTWMPELTRFVWVVWLVVGFAFTYGNYLISLELS